MKIKWVLLILVLMFGYVSFGTVNAALYFGIDNGYVTVWKDKWAYGLADSELTTTDIYTQRSALQKLAQSLGPYVEDITARDLAEDAKDTATTAINQTQINTEEITNINADLTEVLVKNNEQDNRLNVLEQDRVAPLINKFDTKIPNKSAVDLSEEGNIIWFVVYAQDNVTPFTNLEYRINGGVWSDIPINGEVAGTVASGANTFEIEVRDQQGNVSNKFKLNRTIWGL